MNIAISAPPPIDLSADTWTAAKLHRAFLQHGCAVVRSVMPTGRLRRFKRLIEKAYRRKGEPLHVDANDIAAASWFRPSAFDLVATPLLHDFLARVFHGQQWRPFTAQARRIQGRELATINWQQPLKLHLDCFFHPFEWTVNFWVPFDPCGTDAPTLQLLPVDYRRTRTFAEFSPERLRDAEYNNMGHFPEHVISENWPQDILPLDRVTAAFGRDCFIRPTMQPGDVIIASNWIIHGTYQTPQMHKGRTSIEVRFIGDKLDPSPTDRAIVP